MIRRAAVLALGALTIFFTPACGDDDDDDQPDAPEVTISKVDGRLALDTFAVAPPTGVDAMDEVGKRVNAPLAPDGAFAFDLQKNHVYKLLVLTPAGEIPLVFPREGGRLDKTFRVSTGNAIVSLGVIRRFEKNPEPAIALRPSAPTDGAPPCIDGLLQGTPNACVEETLRAACAPGVPADNDDDDDDDGDDARKNNDPARLLEEDADPAQPFALPARNAPNDADHCED